MATKNVRRVEVFHTISGNAPQVIEFPEAASQTFKVGDLLYLVAGYATSLTGVTNPAVILGVALAAGNNGTAGQYSTPVAIANRDTLFGMTIASGAGTTTTAITQVGHTYGITEASSIWRVDVAKFDATGGNSRVNVVRLHPEDAVGDTSGRVVVQFLPKYSQLYSTS